MFQAEHAIVGGVPSSSLNYVLDAGYSYKVAKAVLQASCDFMQHRPDHHLSIAAMEGDTKYMETLFRTVYVDLNFRSPENFETALTNAIMSKNVDSVRCLLALGADPDCFGGDGVSPLYLAAYDNKFLIMKALIEAGADPNKGVILEHGAGSSITTVMGRTPIHASSQAGNAQAIEALISAGADQNRADSRGDTPLHVAATELKFKAVLALLNANADPLTRNTKGQTPLKLSFERQSSETDVLAAQGAIASALVAAGAREWDSVPSPCPFLEHALPVVWAKTPEDLRQLFQRLQPDAKEAVRSALSLFHHQALPTELRIQVTKQMFGEIKDIELAGTGDEMSPMEKDTSELLSGMMCIFEGMDLSNLNELFG